MRVIAGRYKGRRLESPSWRGLRPTSDRLRETLFNVIAARVEGARVIDACAGTGALGIEALSRGAAHVVFIERDRRAVALIRRNLAACVIREGYTMMAQPIERVGAGTLDGTGDLVLVDPPYDAEGMSSVIERAAGWVAPGGLLVLEHAARRPVPDHAGDLSRVRALHSGDSCLTFFGHVDRPTTSRRDP